MSNLPTKSLEDKRIDALKSQVLYGTWVKTAMVATMVLLVIMLTILLNVSSNNFKLIKQLDDCISPDGACFKAAALQESDNVDNIREIVVLASYCARLPGVTDIEKTQLCVAEQLGKIKK